MPNTITWDREMRAKAKAQGTALFAYGFDNRAGKIIAHTPTLTDEEVDCLAGFLLNLTVNHKPLDWCFNRLKMSLDRCKKRKGIKDA
jgi:hypothetical protein